MNDAAHALEQIRRTEMEAARRVEEARTRATEIGKSAEQEARRMIDEGRQRGLEAARRRHQEGLAEAEAEAERIRAGGVAKADELIMLTEENVGRLVDEMAEVVLAPPLERGK
jgi:vacuolar-type H+-ATPase subunit H